MYYLETEIGFEKFKQIYDIIKSVDDSKIGENIVEYYWEKVKNLIDAKQFQRVLVPYLTLKKMEKQTNDNP